MKFDQLHPEVIRVGERHRQLNEATLVPLMESVKRIGLQIPISVRWAEEDNPDFSAELIAGRHRLEVARRLGWESIPVVVHEGDETDARLWEIAENLHRAELTALERDEHVAEWVKLVAAKGAQDAPPGGKQPHDKGIKAAVRELGVDRTSVQRAVKVDKLTPEAKQTAREVGLDDNHSALLRAAKQSSKEDQLRQLREDAARAEARREERTKPAPAIKNAFESEEDWRRSLFTVWNRGAQEWRERALETLDPPVSRF